MDYATTNDIQEIVEADRKMFGIILFNTNHLKAKSTLE